MNHFYTRITEHQTNEDTKQGKIGEFLWSWHQSFHPLTAITLTTNKTTTNGSGRADMTRYGQKKCIAAKCTEGE